jgi:hypothetical protein
VYFAEYGSLSCWPTPISTASTSSLVSSLADKTEEKKQEKQKTKKQKKVTGFTFHIKALLCCPE